MLERMAFPVPVIDISVEPRTKESVEKMSLGLQKRAGEDPSLRPRTDQETGQTILSGMGELHLEIIIDRLRISMLPADWADKHKDDLLYGLGALQGKGFVLTAPTKALQGMVLAHGNDDGAFEEATVLVRPGQKGGSCYSEK